MRVGMEQQSCRKKLCKLLRLIDFVELPFAGIKITDPSQGEKKDQVLEEKGWSPEEEVDGPKRGQVGSNVGGLGCERAYDGKGIDELSIEESRYKNTDN
ncbi:hypothetical protein CRV24_006066 [Beauveria bassiana]|nr:hypothetical protein CRV24_006066 [Beauveria bassiana]KAH8708953.1 hypothetical protein HC256_008883 [Beauveria bassiana]